jgi:hypothetical protein
LAALAGTCPAFFHSMSDDAIDEAPPRSPRTPAMCPQCHNPHTIVAEQLYRGIMRFCPMCDHSWVIGEVSRDVTNRESRIVNRESKEPKAGDGGPDGES